MSAIIKTLRYRKEIVLIYASSILLALIVAASYGLSPIRFDTATGILKTVMIVGTFFIPFVITAILSDELRKRDKFTSYMQAWVDVSIYWILFAGLVGSIISKSPNFYTF